MIRFELSAGPPISVLKLNSEHIVCFRRLAIFDSGLAAVFGELESDNCIGWNRLFNAETCA